jgi:hypothetical protein
MFSVRKTRRRTSQTAPSHSKKKKNMKSQFSKTDYLALDNAIDLLGDALHDETPLVSA